MARSTSLSAVLFGLAAVLAAGPAEAFDLEFAAASPQIYDTPHDLVLAPDGRHLYVADNDNDRIAVLDPKTLELLGTFGEGEVSAPHDAAFDAEGRLLVADTGNSRIAIYSVEGVEGRLVSELRGAIRRPEGVAVHPNGRIYASGARSDNVEAFEDGTSVGEAAGFSSPHDLAVAADGRLWLADAGNDRLVILSPELEVLVADKYANRIKVLAPDGRLVLTLGSGRGELGPGVFDRPEGVAIRGADVWISDTYNDRIVRYRIVE